MTSAQEQQGFSLVELIVSIVVIGLALASVASFLAFGAGRGADVLLEARAAALGQAYLDEILSRRFDERTNPSGRRPCTTLPPGANACTAEIDFGPDGGESRSSFDDVDDYHGLEEGDGAAFPLRDAEGNTRSGYENFFVEIQVRYAGADDVLDLAPVDAKHITVGVSHRTADASLEFSVYKANY